MTDFARPEWLEVPGGRLAYERAGTGAPLVFLHAAIADRRQWDREFRSLAGGATAVRYDRRGFGQSAPATASYSDLDDLHALFRHLKLGPATIVGNSMGGSLALDYALEHPRDVRGLMLISPGLSGWDPKMDPEGQPTYESDMKRSGGISTAWKAGRKDEALDQLFAYWAPAVPAADAGLVRQMMHENLVEALDERSAHFAQPAATPAAGRLGSVHVPTTVLIGDRDEPTMSYIVRRVARGIPGARFVQVPGADHLLNLSRPAAFDEELRALRAREKSA